MKGPIDMVVLRIDKSFSDKYIPVLLGMRMRFFYNPRPQGKINEYSRPTFPRCVKKHEGSCLAGKDSLYGCAKSGHIMKD